MKKIMFMIALICACFCNAQAEEQYTVDAYDVKMSVQMPYLNKGIRLYKTVSMVGTMYLTYDGVELTDAKMTFLNKTTKVLHEVSLTNSMYNLIGKSNKYSDKTVPTVFFEGVDEDDSYGHEFISKMFLAGNGSIKTIKTTTTGCASCGIPVKTTSICNKLYSINGYVVGVMDCLCPEDEEWNHTIIAGPCGVWTGYLEDIRSHEASFKGSWSAKWNKKLSAEETEAANLDL